MFKWLKKTFIPHEHNDFKPHLFRENGVLSLFIIIVLVFILAVSGKIIIDRTDITALVLPKVLVDYANEDRATGDFNDLAINPVLEKAAQLKAEDMAKNGYFAHTSPEGKNPWYWFKQVGYNFSYAGENLAVNFTDSVEVNKAWMNSPGHRANIMNGNFTEIGVATAEGIYQGKKTVFVVELFGRPAKKVETAENKNLVTGKNEDNSKTPSLVSGSQVLAETISSETFDENGGSELYIAVENKEPAEILNSSSTKNSSLAEKWVMSPDEILSWSYLVLAILIIIGLILTIFIEIKKQHPRLILLAVGLLIIIIGLLYIYKSVLFAPLIIA